MHEHLKIIHAESRDKKVVFVSGNFNILHPGHLRLLKFAKDSGDYLVVGVNNQIPNSNLLDADIRLEALLHSIYVDYAFILSSDALSFIEALKPNIVVKGNEHEYQHNPELSLIQTYGGKLLFSSGDIRFSSLELLKNEFELQEFTNVKQPLSYLSRHNIKSASIKEIMTKMKELHVVVIGDTIIDEYITCDPLGMSQEDPTIVVTPISTDTFIGGAAIVASHAAGLGAKVNFFSVLGEDEHVEYVTSSLDKNHVKTHLYSDASRPTTRKQRFRAHRKTLLRVNHLKQHNISLELQHKIFSDISSLVNKPDLIVFSDFSYGVLPQNLINQITHYANEHNIMMVADSQSSSQTGDISKFHSASLVTPTEKEARLALNDFESGLIVLAENLRKKSSIKNVFITLGEEGLLIHADQNNNEWLTDQIPALNTAPKDVAGAGDSLLISSAMAISAGASILQAAYIGSLAAACQVARVGNTPLKEQDITQELA